MNTFIACCGIDCTNCDARIATVNDNDDLRIKTAEKWNEIYNSSDITPKTINCMGCRTDGIKFSHCNECEIRKCVKSKGFETCGNCSEIDTCNIVGFIFKYVPEAKSNLLSV